MSPEQFAISRNATQEFLRQRWKSAEILEKSAASVVLKKGTNFSEQRDNKTKVLPTNVSKDLRQLIKGRVQEQQSEIPALPEIEIDETDYGNGSSDTEQNEEAPQPRKKNFRRSKSISYAS